MMIIYITYDGTSLNKGVKPDWDFATFIEAHGAGPLTAQKLFELNPDLLITGNGPGGNAARVLDQSGMKIFIRAGDMTVQQAYQAYRQAKLREM